MDSFVAVGYVKATAIRLAVRVALKVLIATQFLSRKFVVLELAAITVGAENVFPKSVDLLSKTEERSRGGVPVTPSVLR